MQEFANFEFCPSRMKSLFTVFCFLVVSSVSAQTGNYFLSHYAPQERFNSICFDITQDQRGLFYYATQSGVLAFDGRNWHVIRTKGATYAIEITTTGSIYAGGSAGFGKIVEDKQGVHHYESILETPEAENIFQIVAIQDRVYFINEKTIFHYDGSKETVEKIENENTSLSWNSLFELGGSVYVSAESGGVYKAEGNKLVKSNLNIPSDVSIAYTARFNNQYILVSTDSRVFICPPSVQIEELSLKDSAYITTSVIVSATWVNNSLIALGTLRGGVVFLNPVTGATEEIINYNTGLPDNEVFHLTTDQNQNVWAAHTYGFTRISPYLPFRSFSYYPGLKGNLLCATTLGETVYVGTSLGLYRLEREEHYDELVYYVNVPVKTSVKQAIVDEEQEKEKGGFLRFLSRKKKPKENEQEITKEQVEYKREKRTKKILRDSFYRFKKVEGIDSKVSQLIFWDGKLLASGLDGVFEVNQKAEPVIKDPVRFLFAPVSHESLFASLYDDRIHVFTKEKNNWKDSLLRDVDESVHYIFEEENGNIWFTAFDKSFRFNVASKSVQKIELTNPANDKMLGLSYDDNVVLVNSSGFYYYAEKQNTIAKIDTLPAPVSYFADASALWFRDEHAWFQVGMLTTNNLQLLNLFKEIRFISTDPRGQHWIITGNNELFRFNSDRIQPYETSFPLFLKTIEQEDQLISRNLNLKIDQESSSLKVEVIKPDYFNARAIEYRYFLTGLNASWSEWSTSNNIIDFPYLPPGDYKLNIQSKDIFGQITEMEPMTIKVLPPYWKQSWFYALEFVLFGALVLLSFRLSHRFILVSRVLSLLSIIILIEFIQTAAGATFNAGGGPVIEFLIQVGIAFVILPIEGFLRKFMLRSIEMVKLRKLEESEKFDIVKNE